LVSQAVSDIGPSMLRVVEAKLEEAALSRAKGIRLPPLPLGASAKLHALVSYAQVYFRLAVDVSHDQDAIRVTVGFIGK